MAIIFSKIVRIRQNGSSAFENRDDFVFGRIDKYRMIKHNEIHCDENSFYIFFVKS